MKNHYYDTTMDWQEKINNIKSSNNHESRLDTYRYTMILYIVLILNTGFLPNSYSIYFSNKSIVIAAISNYFNVFSTHNSLPCIGIIDE